MNFYLNGLPVGVACDSLTPQKAIRYVWVIVDETRSRVVSRLAIRVYALEHVSMARTTAGSRVWHCRTSSLDWATRGHGPENKHAPRVHLMFHSSTGGPYIPPSPKGGT